MAYTTINKSSDFFNTLLYAGNDGTGRSITGVGFQPDFVWIKDRSNAINHSLFDAVRGATKELNSNANTAEETEADMLTAFGTDGFTLNSAGGVNGNNNNYASWNWKAGGGQGSSNTDGSINTTYTSVNTTAGFSISKYTGTGNAGATIGHGLGAVPNWILIKKLAGGSARDWAVYHSANTSAPETEILYLNNTDATADSSAYWNDTAPTSSIITLGAANEVNESPGHTYVAYCFAEKTGYSKFGSYTGNGSSNGPFVYLGFKPSFLMVKRTNSTSDWLICDNKRNNHSITYPQNNINPVNGKIFANLNQAEEFYNSYDFLSNGFKIKTSGTGHNASGANMIYMAFAEAPLVGSNNVPCTAR